MARAIEAIDEPPTVPTVVVTVPFGDGRRVVLQVPADFQIVETMALIGWMANGGLAAELSRAPRSRILVPS